MTDITELAQSLKAAAENAGADYWQAKKISGEFYVIRKGSYSSKCGYCTYQPIAEIDHKSTRDYVAIASPANILALVEALEKAQAKNALVAGGIEASTKLHERIADLEGDVEKWKQESASWEAVANKQLGIVADLESRTVTVKLPVSLDFDCEMENGDYDIDEEPYLRGKVDGFNYALTKVRRLNGTAGIKWEAE
ncbi:hypothetical protein [Klebsiella sp. 2HUAk36cef]|uniref:hypothetical protein n=1 Tax=Klebsiella TaxID=570 RepID=UPI0038F0BF9A